MGWAEVAVRPRALLSFRGRWRVLHLTWMALFLSFLVWFSFAPLATQVGRSLGLTAPQLAALSLCNVALTVPGRVLVGMAVDRWGSRRVYGAVLLYAAVPTLVFATASSFRLLVASRLAVSLVGAGFVAGVRMMAEWFPPHEIGLAQGIYGGWGNAGSAAAAFTLPTVAAMVGGPEGWRWAIGTTGALAAVYGGVYLRAVSDTPDGSADRRALRRGALEVNHPAAVVGVVALQVPLVGVLALVAWQLARLDLLQLDALRAVLTGLVVVFCVQVWRALAVNRPARRRARAPDDDRIRAIVTLCLAYAVTFGSGLAVVSMLPGFFADTFGLSPLVAGLVVSAYAFTNLVARPAGGLCSDLLGSRQRTLQVVLVGLAVGYAGMASVQRSWLLAATVAVASSLFVHAGAGATYAIVPLVEPRACGQIAGLVGAYGNVGALLYLALLPIVGPARFFAVIAVSAVAVAASLRWLPEPQAAGLTDRRLSRTAPLPAGTAPLPEAVACPEGRP